MAEAKRNSRRTKRSRDRVISFNSSIPEKTAKREVRLSNQESWANSERKKHESVFARRDIQFIRGPDLQMEKRFSKTETRKRDGYVPCPNHPLLSRLMEKSGLTGAPRSREEDHPSVRSKGILSCATS